MNFLSREQFKAWFIDIAEEKYFPIILSPFNKNSYILLKELEETFYREDDGETLKMFSDNGIMIIDYSNGMRAKEDGLRSTAIYLIYELMPSDFSLFVLIKKEEYTKKRLRYLFEKYKIPNKILFGPNKNYLNQNKNDKRNPIDSKLRHEVFKRDDYKCKECGATNKEKILHVDHILPVAQGGTDELSNLQTLCSDCNLSKSNKKWDGGDNGNSNS
jgi:5-methylcytosine-specific restriction enzyme A